MTIRELLTKISLGVNLGVFSNVLNKINGIKGGLLGIVAGAAGAAAGIAGFALKAAGEFEQSSIAFETMLGSAEKAQALLEDITTFAAQTPFELTGLIDSSKKLLAFGIASEDIISTMTNLGNIAAGVGTDKLPSLTLAFGKIRTKGKASMEELNILLEAGVPILDELSAGFGVTTQELFKMVSAGKVGFGDVDAALGRLATGNGKFANLMEKQSKSFFGIISNIKDTIGILARDIGQTLLPTAKELAKGLLEFVEANKDLIKTNIQKFLGAMAKVAKFLFGVFTSVASAVFSLIDGVSGLIDVLGGAKGVAIALSGVMFTLVGTKMRRGWRLLRVAVKRGLIPALKGAGKAARALNIKLLLVPVLVAIALNELLKFSRGEANIFTLIGEALKLGGLQITLFFAKITKAIKDFSPILDTFLITPIVGAINLLNKLGDKLDSFQQKKGTEQILGEKGALEQAFGNPPSRPPGPGGGNGGPPIRIDKVEIPITETISANDTANRVKEIFVEDFLKRVKPFSDGVGTPGTVTP